MKRLLNAVVFALLLVSLGAPASGCSMASCIDGGTEMRREFVVRVEHDGKPLAGVSVQVITDGPIIFSGSTASDGVVRVTNLPVGEYWLKADLLGVLAGSECFHVAERASRKAKRSVKYEWGDFAPATRRIMGKLVDSRPGQGGTPIWNLVHPTKVPITGTRLILQNPITGRVFETTSDQGGSFAFDGIPNGTYVLRAEGGRSDREYDSADFLIRVGPKATRDTLLITRSDPGGGSCGGTSLELLQARY